MAIAGGVAFATTKIKNPNAQMALMGALGFIPGATEGWQKAQRNAAFMRWAAQKIAENHRNFRAAKNVGKALVVRR